MRVLEKSQADQRRTRILNALVSAYISTGSPVSSSRALARSRLELSPATVRSVMGELDQLGFTVQPHTSAGRIPTQKGFRVFVDSWAFNDTPAKEFWADVEKNYDLPLEEQGSIAGLLERCCSLLSEVSEEAGVVLSPAFLNDVVREIKLVQVDPGRIVAVVISDLGIVTSTTVHVGNKLSYFNLKHIEQYLNARLRGPDFAGAFSEGYLDDAEAAATDRLYSEVILKYLVSGGSAGKRQLYLEGFSRIFEKKELRTPEAACSAVRFFEDRSRLMGVLAACQRTDGVTVLVGDEIPACDELGIDLGLVAAPYTVNAIPAGALGVIGSMRMKYSKVVPLVEHAASFLSRKLSELCGRGRIAFESHQSHRMPMWPRAGWAADR